MLFDVSRGELVGLFGEDRVATPSGTAFPTGVVDTEGAQLLRTVGVPTGTLGLREPDEGSGLLPLVRDVVDVEGAPEGAGEWPVIGWLLNAHLALDPRSGRVYAFDADESTAQVLHADVSSLIQVTLRFQRLLDEFTFSGGEGDDGDEEAGFERLERAVEEVRRATSGIDPFPFQDDETVWSVVGDEIAAGQRFTGDSPAARSLYG
ncbi:SUKH-4 family immunity protein [Streptomyces sp. NPDC048202]|uniref:SUKH-4 family immunity protein n=1 Tax=Streptomyces sp. NPDC048202 TaxID=3365514 RepID=UPI00371BFF4E